MARLLPLARALAGLGLGLVLLLAGGCASRSGHPAAPLATGGTPPSADAVAQAKRSVASLFPPSYRAVHRVIIRFRNGQYTCDGVHTVSPERGHHLAVVSSLGAVTALRVRGDGEPEVLKVTPLFREEWTRRYVARDLRRLFMPPALLTAVGAPGPDSFALETAPDASGSVARYGFSNDGKRLRSIELIQNGRCGYHAEVLRYRTFAPGVEVPAEFRVQADGYQLELRVAELSVPQLAREATP